MDDLEGLNPENRSVLCILVSKLLRMDKGRDTWETGWILAPFSEHDSELICHGWIPVLTCSNYSTVVLVR